MRQTGIMKIQSTTTLTGLTRAERIRLHLLCPWRTMEEARFHLAGIMRELGVRFPA